MIVVVKSGNGSEGKEYNDVLVGKAVRAAHPPASFRANAPFAAVHVTRGMLTAAARKCLEANDMEY